MRPTAADCPAPTYVQHSVLSKIFGGPEQSSGAPCAPVCPRGSAGSAVRTDGAGRHARDEWTPRPAPTSDLSTAFNDM